MSKKGIRTACLSFFGAVISLGFVSCSSSPNLVRIKVQLNDISQQWLYLCQWNGARNIVVDSVMTNSRGKAKFKYIAQSPEVIAFTKDKTVFPIALFVKPGENIEVTGSLNNYTITGSKESAEVKILEDKLNLVIGDIDKLKYQLPDSINSPSADSIARIINSKIDSLYTDVQNQGETYIKSNLFSLSSVFVMSSKLDAKNDLFPYATYRDLYMKLDSCLSLVYPDKPVVKSFKEYIYSKEKLYTIERNAVSIKDGSAIMPVNFTLVDGRTVTIPGLWAKLILIDFWADWCGECKNRLYDYKQINKDFSKKGLVIIQIAADFNADSLNKIVTRDSLNWLHVAEIDPYNSTVFKSLGVVKLPANFLVDRWGRVVATNVYGDSLVAKLTSILDVKPSRNKVVADSTRNRLHTSN